MRSRAGPAVQASPRQRQGAAAPPRPGPVPRGPHGPHGSARAQPPRGGRSLVSLGPGRFSHVVPQGRPDDLPAPLGAGPPGELGPRQHLIYPRHVILGDGDPEHDGDARCIRQPGTRHAFKVPRTARLERKRLRVKPAKNNQAKACAGRKTACSAIRSKSLPRQGRISSRCWCGPPMSGPSGPGSSVPGSRGAVAQLVAHLHGMEGVRGSNPSAPPRGLHVSVRPIFTFWSDIPVGALWFGWGRPVLCAAVCLRWWLSGVRGRFAGMLLLSACSVVMRV